MGSRNIGGTQRAGAALGYGALLVGVLALASMPVIAGGPTGDLERHEYRRVIMGTQARIVLYAADDAVGREAAAAAFARMVAMDDLLTDWRPSELLRLGEAAGGPPVVVSADLLRILRLAAEVSEASRGAFDVTVGPLTQLWRKTRAEGRLPDPGVLAAARDATGWTKVVLDPAASTVELPVPGMRLDMGAVGKGYACDRALETLEAHGVTRALVEIGGDMVCGDAPPGRAGWRVATGCGEGAAPSPILVLKDEAVATSGDTEQHVVIDGVRYSHIVDPRTGLGLTESECVTVVAPSGALADALASAVSIRGKDQSLSMLARFGARVPGLPPVPAADDAWVELFDGETLNGWTTRGGRYDGDAVWTVEEGILTGRVGDGNAGGLLYTEAQYTSFEFACETKIDYPFDSGIFLRMVPPGSGKGAQVTLDDRPDGEVGGIYADGWLAHHAEGGTPWKRDEWNHVRVKCTGFDMHIEVWMNDRKTMDYSVPPGTRGFAPRGRIGVQVHGGRDDPGRNAARFRNLRVRALPVFGEGPFAPATSGLPDRLVPTAEGRAAGWQALPFPDDLEGWEASGPPEVFGARDGVLSIAARPDGGYLATAKSYRDFALRFDFQLPWATRSGVLLRATPGALDPAASGCEVQLHDEWDWEAPAGSLYGVEGPGRRGALRPPGRWNTCEILYQGPRLAVALNGVPLYDVLTTELAPTLGPPFAQRAAAGFLGLRAPGSPRAAAADAILFRNLFLRER